ncbi:MAG: hypothetical protein V3T93_05325 [Alphaproteobacteria bacterium]
MPTWIIALLKWGGIAPAVIGGAARVRAPGRCPEDESRDGSRGEENLGRDSQ